MTRYMTSIEEIKKRVKEIQSRGYEEIRPKDKNKKNSKKK